MPPAVQYAPAVREAELCRLRAVRSARRIFSAEEAQRGTPRRRGLCELASRVGGFHYCSVRADASQCARVPHFGDPPPAAHLPHAAAGVIGDETTVAVCTAVKHAVLRPAAAHAAAPVCRRERARAAPPAVPEATRIPRAVSIYAFALRTGRQALDEMARIRNHALRQSKRASTP